MKADDRTHYDKMTQTPVARLVISLGIPTTISMLVTNLYNMVDTFFVGKLGNSASGAIGVVFGFMSILQAVGFMLGQGAGSVISRLLGKKDNENASCYASTSFFLAFFMGMIIEICGFIFLDPMLRALGSTETILVYAREYVTYILIAAPFMISCFVMNNVLRSEGKASLSMWGLLSGAILNIIGDPILMFGLDMGIAGAGLSTAISQIISFCILLSMFLRGKTQSKLAIRNFSMNIHVLSNIVTTGAPSLLRQGLSSVSTMMLNHAAGIYGDPAVAAMSVVNRIHMFIFSVGLGIGQGYQPVCGFNYGAGKYKRVKKAYIFTLSAGECLIGVLAVLGWFLAEPAIRVFRNDDAVVAIGVVAMRLQCVALFFQPLMVVTNMTLQSSGKKGLAIFTAMLRSGLCFIPTLLLMSRLTGLFGVQSAQPIADILSFMIALPIAVGYFKKLPKEDA